MVQQLSSHLIYPESDRKLFLTFVELGKLRQQEKQKIEQLEQAQKNAIPRLYDLGLTEKHIADSLSLSYEKN
ncbi:MAG: hypothetical protein QNJ42_25385 [Crocosphaera sp.]|nr:hypothetical protein [Crocosphaera sp.]